MIQAVGQTEIPAPNLIPLLDHIETLPYPAHELLRTYVQGR